jgi:hypothetical protein
VSRAAGAWFYAALAVLVLALGLARLWLGPWYYTWNPLEVSLLERWPAAWEVAYYTEQFPQFLGNAPAKFGIALVHYRTFAALYLAAALDAWTGSAFWSLAAVDLIFWFLGGVATYHLARRLGVHDRGARIAALLVVASPLFVSHLWRLDLHTANFASMAIGLWAVVALIDECRRRPLLILALGALLVWLGLNYSYQWVVMPLLFVLTLTSGRLGWVSSIAVPVGAIGLYFAGTRALEWLFATAVAPPTEFTHVAEQPGGLIVQRLAADGISGTLRQLLDPYPILLMVRAYHPVVLGAGIGGALLLSRRVILLTAVGLAVALYSVTSYSAPWAATVSYPLVYIGAGHACAACGRLARRFAVPVAFALGAAMMAVTNLDLVGNTRFLLTWWTYFAGRYLF